MSHAHEEPDGEGAPDLDNGADGNGSDPWWHRDHDREGDHPGSSTAALLGVAAEEILKLAEGVQKWGRGAGVGTAAREAMGQVSAALEAVAEPDPAWCQVCPVCRMATAVSTVRPDLAGNLAEALALVTAVAHAALDAVAGDPPAGSSKLD